MVFLIKLIDKHVGDLICNVIGIFNKNKLKEIRKVDRILVVQLWGIGETILTLPAIEALRRKFPKSEINALVTARNKDIYFNNKNIGKIIVLKLNPFSINSFILKNAKKYDLVMDMEEYLNVSAIISFFVGRRVVGYSHNARAKLYTRRVKYNDKQHAVQTFLDLVRALDINYNASRLPELNFSKNDKNVVDKFVIF